MKPPKFPVFPGGCNVFDWILVESHKLREIRQQENRDVAKAAKESKRLELRELANKEREAVDAGTKGYRRALSSRFSNQGS